MQKSIFFRLKEERERNKLTQQNIADITEVNVKTARRWEQENAIPSDKLNLLDGTGLDVCYILTGKRNDEEKNVLSESGFSYIPIYDVEVSAGFGSVNYGVTKPDDVLAFRKDWLAKRGLHQENLHLVIARGDSMEPAISNKDTLLVNTAENVPKDGNIYIIRNGDTLWVKRIQPQIDGTLSLISDNKNYPVMTLDLDNNSDTEIIGRVVSISKDLG